MKRIIVLSFVTVSLLFPDNIYLKTGMVIRNAQVTDSTADTLMVNRDGTIQSIAQKNIARVEQVPVDPSKRSSYELYSQQLWDETHRAIEHVNYIYVDPHKSEHDIEVLWTITTNSRMIIGTDSIFLSDNGMVHSRTSEGVISIPIDSVNEMRQFRSKGYLRGAAIGASIGGVIGLMMYAVDDMHSSGSWNMDIPVQNYVLFNALIGGITGTVIAGTNTRDQVYDFTKLTTEEKKRIVREYNSSL